MRQGDLNALVVLARYPRAGQVKTRLAASIGDEATVEIYRAFLSDIGRRFSGHDGWTLHWAFEPAETPFRAEFAPEAKAFPQCGDDLGERMAAAFALVLAEGYSSAVLIGADVPHVPMATIGGAFRLLQERASLVLGPAEDGGYYLIGARSVPPVFTGIRWGGANVFDETVAAARVAGLSPVLLPKTYDIDERADLERLQADIAAGRVDDLAATAAVLTRQRQAIGGGSRPTGAT